jgi:hypothetical protein
MRERETGREKRKWDSSETPYLKGERDTEKSSGFEASRPGKSIFERG